MNQVYKNLALWMVIGLIVILLFTVFQGAQQSGQEQPNFSEFLKAVDLGRVETVTIRGNLVTYTLKDSAQTQRTYIVEYPELIKTLKDRGVRIAVKPPDQNPWYTIVLQWFPMLLFIGVWIFFMRQMQGGGAKALSFGKARARLISEKQNKITFQDVAGIDEAKEEVVEIIEFLKDPQKFQKLGGKIPKGVLLVGPPGTGKTLLARAVAGEAGVPFFSISGSDFVEMFVGVGASRVRDLFEQAKQAAPCIVFMDEIDAVGRHRGAGLGGGHDEREQTLNQLLVEMDGFETNEGVILIAATNRPDVLDPALLRPGRFDRQVVVPRPDVKGREEILRVHARRIPLAPNVELKMLARGTPGFSGADLANLVNEAALLAARQNKKLVEMLDFESAKDKVLMGVERRSMIISDSEKRTIAYHEAGHALVADFLPGADPLHKVTIIPRGRALGLTMQLPMDDKYNYSREYLINRITILLGGRSAEEIVLKQQTTGAGDDLEKATEMARKMVCEWGMSDTLGPLTFGKNEEHIFLGREVARPKDYGEGTALAIDSEMKRIVIEGSTRARHILDANIEKLHALARALLEPVGSIIDVGARSTSPYRSAAVTADEERERLVRAVEARAAKLPVPVSADTTRATVAEAALEAGARVVNDVSGLADPAMGGVVRSHGAGVVLMAHPDVAPSPRPDPVLAVRAALAAALARARRSGIPDEHVVLDPGIGFFRDEAGAWGGWDVPRPARPPALSELRPPPPL